MISLDDEIEAVHREIKMRRYVYPRRVSDGAMTQKKADHEIACMEATLKRLQFAQQETMLRL